MDGKLKKLLMTIIWHEICYNSNRDTVAGCTTNVSETVNPKCCGGFGYVKK